MRYSKNRNYSKGKLGRVVSLILAVVVILLVVGLFNGNKKDDYELQHLKFEYGSINNEADVLEPDLIEDSSNSLYSNTYLIDGPLKIENKIDDGSAVIVFMYTSDGTYICADNTINKPGTFYLDPCADSGFEEILIKICILAKQDDFNIDFFEKLDYISKIKLYTAVTKDTND